jgi:dihydropteroate synthase
MNNQTLCHWHDRTYIMGVLNVTPDSFSDGGQFNNPQARDRSWEIDGRRWGGYY